MRKNLPVTQKNYTFKGHLTLISVTDLQGRITYCNNDFVRVSGYLPHELLGQPHNIVRHPDMPAEAFRDFWATIESGELWSGIIKNRRKNGDHYWVRANATPMRDGSRIVGYLSVRTLALGPEIEAAQAMYRAMWHESGKRRRAYRLKGGLLERKTLTNYALSAIKPGALSKSIVITQTATFAVVGASVLHWSVVWQALIAILTATAAAALIHSLSERRLRSIVPIARRLASGDLSEFVSVSEPTRGLRRDLLLPIAQLGLSTRTVMVDVRHDLTTLQHTSRTLAQNSQNLAVRTQKQALSLENAAVAMDEINATVQQIFALASKGVSLARDMVATTHHSLEAVSDMATTMRALASSSHHIGSITAQIEEIAFQTNILALNASIEAARASTQRRGLRSWLIRSANSPSTQAA